jgi:low temperature requirement protein LtrA
MKWNSKLKRENMMRDCVAWILAVPVSGLLVMGLVRLTGQSGFPLYLGYGIGYAVFAALLLVALRQCRPGWHPAMQRMAALLAGAGLAGVDVFIAGLTGETAQQAFFGALLGVALVQVTARLFDPKKVRRD